MNAKEKKIKELNNEFESLKSQFNQAPAETQEAMSKRMSEITKEIEALKKENISDKGRASAKGKDVDTAKLELSIMDKYAKSTLFKNEKGEYFTNESYAKNSLPGKNYSTITRESLEKIIS